MWFYFSLVSALMSGFGNIARRTHGSLAEPAELSWWSFLIGMPLGFGLLLVSDQPYYTSHAFIAPMLITCLLNSFANVMQYKAYKYGDASLISPITNFLPIMLLFTSFLILGVVPSWGGLIGVILVVAGVYYTSVSGKHALHHPLRQIFRNRGSRAMLITVVLWSIGNIFEKISLRTVSPAFLTAFQAVITFSFISTYLLFKLKLSGKKRIKRGEQVMRRWGWHIAAISVFGTLGAFFQFHAVALVSNPSYPLAVKRLDVLFTVVLAGLFLREKHIFKRFQGALIAVLGVAIIYIAR